jgi:hypothetical protein
MVTVSNSSNTGTVPFIQGFETGSFPYNDWFLLNSNGGNTWQISPLAAATGTKSLYINNFNGNDKGPDEFITPAINLSNVSATQMTYALAFALKSTTASNTDRLAIYFSTNCGQTWTVRKGLSGTALATTTSAVTTNFIPNASQWRTETVNLGLFSISGQPNVRLRFEFTHDTGNNIFIDDININGTISGVQQIVPDDTNVNVYPNPSSAITYVDFSTKSFGQVEIEIHDISGRLIKSFVDNLPAGDHQYTISDPLVKGVYTVKINTGYEVVTKKLIIQ